MADEKSVAIYKFRGDVTRRLSPRAGQFLLWFQLRSMFAGGQPSDWQNIDFWEFRDGDSVTITNRICDLPRWFQLHPTEVSGWKNIREFQPKLDAGEYPDEPIQAMNLWRVPAGARIAWINVTDSRVPPVLEIVDFTRCALVIGDNATGDFESLAFFGQPSTTQMSPALEAVWRQAAAEVASRGIPRVMTVEEWALGG